MHRYVSNKSADIRCAMLDDSKAFDHIISKFFVEVSLHL